MGRQRKSIGDLGGLGILRETLNLFRGHTKALLSIYLTLLIPCAVLSFAFQQYFNHTKFFQQFLDKFSLKPVLAELQPIPIADIISKDIWLVLAAAVLQQVSSGLGVQSAPVLAMALFILLATLLMSVIWIVPLVSTVGCIYTRDRLSFVQVLAELSLLWRPWKRVLFTGLWGFLAIVAVLVFSNALSQMQLLYISSRTNWQPTSRGDNVVALSIILSILISSWSIVAVMYLVTILQIAYGVAVLEVTEDTTGDYRWDALVKSYRLLAGKRGIALFVLVFYSLCGAVLSFMVWKVKRESTLLNDTKAQEWRRFIVQTAHVALSALVTMLSSLSSAVLYVSCKTFHHEVLVVEQGSLLIDHVVDKDYLPAMSCDIDSGPVVYSMP